MRVNVAAAASSVVLFQCYSNGKTSLKGCY